MDSLFYIMPPFLWNMLNMLKQSLYFDFTSLATTGAVHLFCQSCLFLDGMLVCSTVQLQVLVKNKTIIMCFWQIALLRYWYSVMLLMMRNMRLVMYKQLNQSVRDSKSHTWQWEFVCIYTEMNSIIYASCDTMHKNKHK